MLDRYITQDGKRLRLGYTTGSTATGAAKAAATMLETGREIDLVEIETPAMIDLALEVVDIEFGEGYVSCGIIKDAGDDPDSTDGIKIFAKVSRREDSKIVIDGGEGIGRITKKGLFGQVGEAAINPVPRQMIEKELREVSSFGYNVLIYVPEGVEVGKKTFNKNIGIEGGISIIGTKGIVYPMSNDALIKTIELELDSIYEEYGSGRILFVLGNHGEALIKEKGIDLPTVKISNFIGEAFSYAYYKGFRDFLLVGHIGKLSKLSIGIFNTHNRTADTRLEAFIYYMAMAGISYEKLLEVNQLTTAEQATEYLYDRDLDYIIGDMERGAEERIRTYLKDDRVKVQVGIYSMNRGLYGC
ncbi:MAG: cobalamin biosynthesis protein CbiD [Tissierellia bacterium]|nr:cobalamin biosynthesis protein CbiD [Tissierellia bacterium]